MWWRKVRYRRIRDRREGGRWDEEVRYDNGREKRRRDETKEKKGEERDRKEGSR